LSFFFKKPKRKKSTTSPQQPDINEENLAAVEEAEYDEQVEQDDEGQIAHDESTVKSVRDRSIEYMKELGVEMTTYEENMALNLFPKVLQLFILHLIFNAFGSGCWTCSSDP